jgi:hypothetical protein
VPRAIHSNTERPMHPPLLPLPFEGEAVDAANTIAPEARIDGVSVQEMVRDGVEVIIGVCCDTQLGRVPERCEL